MADKIVAVLKHPPLSQTLRRHAAIGVRQLTWQGAAANCRRVYEEAVESLGCRSRPPDPSKVPLGRVYSGTLRANSPPFEDTDPCRSSSVRNAPLPRSLLPPIMDRAITTRLWSNAFSR